MDEAIAKIFGELPGRGARREGLELGARLSGGNGMAAAISNGSEEFWSSVLGSRGGIVSALFGSAGPSQRSPSGSRPKESPRSPSLSPERTRCWLREQGINSALLAALAGVSRRSVCRYFGARRVDEADVEQIEAAIERLRNGAEDSEQASLRRLLANELYRLEMESSEIARLARMHPSVLSVFMRGHDLLEGHVRRLANVLEEIKGKRRPKIDVAALERWRTRMSADELARRLEIPRRVLRRIEEGRTIELRWAERVAAGLREMEEGQQNVTTFDALQSRLGWRTEELAELSGLDVNLLESVLRGAVELRPEQLQKLAKLPSVDDFNKLDVY